MPYWVGITGGSASGKTFLLQALQKALPENLVTFLSTDHYYKDRDRIPPDPDGRINFDTPAAIDAEKLYQDLLALRQGHTAYQREYTFNNPLLVPRMLEFRPAPLLIAEGLFLFYWAPIRELFDLRIFMEAPEPYRFIKRLERDEQERGYERTYIIEQYLTQVLPAYEQYVAPLRRYAHIVIQNHYGDLSPAITLLVNHLSHLAKNAIL
jgi:uridine kinase